MSFTFVTYAAPQFWPKGYYKTRLPKQAKGMWIKRYKHGSYFEFKVSNPKYVWVGDKTSGWSKSVTQTIVTKSKNARKNRFTLYSPAADPLEIKWAHHHIYYWTLTKWTKMIRYSK
ncbi:hypothetical protein [Lentilactobacillus hilgardii]|uniref:hypothetical protein n=1 Tax=Lentilactobacillus hilgardii TaxID=1588 RepID=UPI0021A3FA55|nr:hypothetical protein [Lentilactobacillus hilgardii]